MEEALAVRNSYAIEGVSGDDLYIKPTFVEITQKMSKNGTFGKFYDVKQETTLDEIEAVPLQVRTKRVLFEKGDISAPPICRSNDGIVPSPFANFKQSATCGSCDKSKWKDKTPPPCNEIKELLYMDRNDGVPRKINFSKMQLSAFNKMLDALQESLIKNRNKHVREVKELIAGGLSEADAIAQATNKVINFYDVKIKMTLETKVTPKGTIALVKFAAPQVLKNLGEFRDDYVRYVLSPAAARATKEEDTGVEEAIDEAMGSFEQRSEPIDAEIIEP